MILADNTVSSSFGECATVGSAGKIYAFIFNPFYDGTSDENDELSDIERNWIFIAMGVIGGATVLVYLVYYLSRQLRYRKKSI